jgi:hypothetical protein
MDGFDRAKTRIKLLLPRSWLRLGEHLVAQLKIYSATLNLVAHCHKSSFWLACLPQRMRRKLMVRGGENRISSWLRDGTEPVRTPR